MGERPGGFDELVRIMALLRAPDGCPWDREQTHMTLRRHLVEEAYETVAAIEGGDDAELADELGDILLQVVFHAQIAAEDGRFDIDDVSNAIVDEAAPPSPAHLRGRARRHPGGGLCALGQHQAHREARRAGSSTASRTRCPRSPTPRRSPAGRSPSGFEWETVDDVWDKVHEEIDELKATSPGTAEAEDEVGDLLFTVVNVARKMGVDPEQALRGTCEKFRRRFAHMEGLAAGERPGPGGMGIDEMEALWRRAKEKERS